MPLPFNRDLTPTTKPTEKCFRKKVGLWVILVVVDRLIFDIDNYDLDLSD